MSTYVIGDVHGCFNELRRLLEKINFKKDEDKIIFIGDLVNRGTQSLEVLDFCLQNRSSVTTVLGNHDLFLLKLMINNSSSKHLKSICLHKNKKEYFDWLIKRPLIIKKKIGPKNFYISHAGIPHVWSMNQAIKISKNVLQLIRKEPKKFFNLMWGNHPKQWMQGLEKDDELRLVINYLTRMRFINKDGKLDLISNGIYSKSGLDPWFKYINLKENQVLIFGHWAALNGKTNLKNIIGLDTGCVWGRKLTAIRLNDEKIFQISK
tara:strand:+ start:7993 stop:8784 length:792 start_codon:yes stop_codon:yes gene_type:complete